MDHIGKLVFDNHVPCHSRHIYTYHCQCLIVVAFSDFYNKWTEMPKVENADNENVDANEKILFYL